VFISLLSRVSTRLVLWPEVRQLLVFQAPEGVGGAIQTLEVVVVEAASAGVEAGEALLLAVMLALSAQMRRPGLKIDSRRTEYVMKWTKSWDLGNISKALNVSVGWSICIL
jgi:hypothetical protein